MAKFKVTLTRKERPFFAIFGKLEDVVEVEICDNLRKKWKQKNTSWEEENLSWISFYLLFSHGESHSDDYGSFRTAQERLKGNTPPRAGTSWVIESFEEVVAA